MKSLGVSQKSKAIKCVGSEKVDPFSIGILWRFPTLGRHYIKCDQRSWLEISACSNLWFLHLHSEPCAIREPPIKWDPKIAPRQKYSTNCTFEDRMFAEFHISHRVFTHRCHFTYGDLTGACYIQSIQRPLGMIKKPV